MGCCLHVGSLSFTPSLLSAVSSLPPFPMAKHPTQLHCISCLSAGRPCGSLRGFTFANVNFSLGGHIAPDMQVVRGGLSWNSGIILQKLGRHAVDLCMHCHAHKAERARALRSGYTAVDVYSKSVNMPRI